METKRDQALASFCAIMVFVIGLSVGIIMGLFLIRAVFSNQSAYVLPFPVERPILPLEGMTCRTEGYEGGVSLICERNVVVED